MAKAIRCGMLGTGHPHAIGKLDVLRRSPDFSLVGICEPDDAVRSEQEGSEAFAGLQWMSQEELLGDESIEMIAVESRVPELLKLGLAAIHARKHIHLDKPAGTSLAQFRHLLGEAERLGRIVQMGYMFRYNEGFNFIRRALRDEWLGQLHYIHGNISTDHISPERRSELAFHPGGIMLELGCHLLDMVVLLLGRPTGVTPFLRHDAEQDDSLADNTLAVLDYEGSVAVIETSCMEALHSQRRIFELCARRGTIVLQPIEPPLIRLGLREPVAGFEAGWQEVRLEHVPRYLRDFEELARSIRGEQSFPYPKHHDLTVQETILRACGENP